jgi:hypothetical protein
MYASKLTQFVDSTIITGIFIVSTLLRDCSDHLSISFLTTTRYSRTGTLNKKYTVVPTYNHTANQQQQQQQHYSTTAAAADVIPLAARVTQSTTCTQPVTTSQQMHCTRLHAVVRPCTALPLLQ